MFKYFTKAFKITNDNIILTTPLVLFLFLLSIYVGIAQNAPENKASAILLFVTILFMLSAFFAGWLYMVKKAIDLDKQEFIMAEDKAKASLALLKDLPVGIGEYFLSFIGAFILYTGLFLLLFSIGYHVGLHFIGKIDLSINELRMAFGSPESMKTLVSSLTTEQLTRLNAWNMLFLGLMAVYSFITMFWAAEIVTKTKNALFAFFRALRFTFKNLLPSIILFVYLSVLNFVVSMINAIAMINPITYFISMLIYFYFFVYVVVLIFLYYDRENQPKFEYTIGNDPENYSSTDSDDNSANNSDTRADSIGQDESGDSESKDD